MGVVRRGSDDFIPLGRAHANACIVICFVILSTLVAMGQRIVQTSSGTDDFHLWVDINPVLLRYHKRYSCV